jgi:hypothetical protein
MGVKSRRFETPANHSGFLLDNMIVVTTPFNSLSQKLSNRLSSFYSHHDSLNSLSTVSSSASHEDEGSAASSLCDICRNEDDGFLSGDEKNHHKKAVSFGEVTVREYEIIIGDHPNCRSGFPVSLGWDFTDRCDVSVDHFEECRCDQRRSKADLYKTPNDRRTMLQDGYSATELKQAERRLARYRAQVARAKTLKSLAKARALAAADSTEKMMILQEESNQVEHCRTREYGKEEKEDFDAIWTRGTFKLERIEEQKRRELACATNVTMWTREK